MFCRWRPLAGICGRWPKRSRPTPRSRASSSPARKAGRFCAGADLDEMSGRARAAARRGAAKPRFDTMHGRAPHFRKHRDLRQARGRRDQRHGAGRRASKSRSPAITGSWPTIRGAARLSGSAGGPHSRRRRHPAAAAPDRRACRRFRFMTAGHVASIRKALAQGIVHKVVARRRTDRRRQGLDQGQAGAAAALGQEGLSHSRRRSAVRQRRSRCSRSATPCCGRRRYDNYPAQRFIMSCVYEGLLVDIDTALKIEARYFVKR